MLLGQIFQSITAWQKLSGINMRPKLAYKILKYTKKVGAEHEIIAKQHDAMVREVAGVEEGQDVKIEPNSPEMTAYAERRIEIMQTESTLKQLDMDFEEVVNAADEKDETLSVSDLAMLEVFFMGGKQEEVTDARDAE